MKQARKAQAHFGSRSGVTTHEQRLQHESLVLRRERGGVSNNSRRNPTLKLVACRRAATSRGVPHLVAVLVVRHSAEQAREIAEAVLSRGKRLGPERDWL